VFKLHRCAGSSIINPWHVCVSLGNSIRYSKAIAGLYELVLIVGDDEHSSWARDALGLESLDDFWVTRA
jgi:hypothetical protein